MDNPAEGNCDTQKRRRTRQGYDLHKIYIVVERNKEGTGQLKGEGGYDGLQQKLAQVLVLDRSMHTDFKRDN